MKNFNEGFRVPNFSKDLSIPDEYTHQNDNPILRILNNLNESEDMDSELDKVHSSEENEEVTCPKCGATYNKSLGECPNCHEALDDAGTDPEDLKKPEIDSEKKVSEAEDDAGTTPDDIKKAEVDSEKKVSESYTVRGGRKLRESEEQDPMKKDDKSKIEEEPSVTESQHYAMSRTLLEYYILCEADDFDKAKEVLETNDAKVDVKPDGVYEIKEADEDGKEASIEMTKDDLDKMKKVEESFNRTSNGHRMYESYHRTSAKASARRAICESIRKNQIANKIQELALTEGVTFSNRALRRAINEGYRVDEADEEMPTSEENKIKKCIKEALEDDGVKVKDIDLEKNEGVTTAHTTIQDDPKAQVYLGDTSDKVSEALDNKYDVDYDEPQQNESDEQEVHVDFHFVPVITTESDESDEPTADDKIKSESECDDPSKLHEDEEDPEVDQTKKLDSISEDDDDDPKESELDKKDPEKVNESLLESYAGGSSNIRAKIFPAYIKSGQVIYDADSRTVFEALSESVQCKRGYSVAVDIANSGDSRLAGLESGSKVTLTPRGNYYLLKENPFND